MDEKRFLKELEGTQYTGLGRSKFREFAKEIGAVKKVGKRCVYDRKVIDAYFDNYSEDTEQIKSAE